MSARMRAARRAAGGSWAISRALWQARANPPQGARARALAVADVFERLLRVHDVRVVVEGRLPNAPSILCANHLSYLDPVVITPYAPALPISKGEVARWPLLGATGLSLGVLFVDRSDPFSGATVLRRALRALEDGANVLNFPEGTTTDGSHTLPFKRGIFGVALELGAPVVPVGIRYESTDVCWTGNAPFVPHYVRTAGRVGVTAYVNFGAAILPRPTHTPESLALLTRGRVLGLLGSPAPDEALRAATGDRDAPSKRLRVHTSRPNPVLSPSHR
jgi:1-acyl-sn-glycerol-3-phosphate acyltransferase